jgi:antitoxin YefM
VHPYIVRLLVHVQPAGQHMDAITYTHAQSHLAETMEKVCDDHALVIITRKNKRSVMISLED